MAASGALYLDLSSGVDISGFSIDCYAGLFSAVEVATIKHHCCHDIVVVLGHIHKDLTPIQILKLEK